jgi:hypothetical protein
LVSDALVHARSALGGLHHEFVLGDVDLPTIGAG